MVTWAGCVPHLGVLATLLTASCNRNGDELRLDGQLDFFSHNPLTPMSDQDRILP